MNPAHEIAPFFPSTTEPGLLRFAADTLRQLRTFSVRNEISVEARSALPAISALLACERYGQDIVSREAAQKSSACSRLIFAAALTKCRRLLPSSSASTNRLKDTASPSGRASMAASSSRAQHSTPPKSSSQSMTPTFDPLNLPGSSAKKVVAPLMRRSSARDLTGLVKNKTGSVATSPDKSKTVAETATSPEKPSTATSTTPTKSRQLPSTSASIASPLKTPQRPLPTPRRAPTTRTARTPTGHGSPMHNALMKNRLEGASAARLASARKPTTASGRVFAEEEDEEGNELPSPKRRRAGARGKVDATGTTPGHPAPTETNPVEFDALPGPSRPATSATKINTLFHPLAAHPLDPQTPIPAPPLVFTGPTIFQRPPAGSRIFDRMVPSDDRAFGDAYALMTDRSRSHPHDVALLEIDVHEVRDAYEKRERARKRRLRRIERAARGFAGWDREFGVPFEEEERDAREVLDWEERLEEFDLKMPNGTRAVIDGLARRHGAVENVDVGSADRKWIERAETHGIAVRIHDM